MKIKISKEIKNSNNKFIFDLLNIDYYYNPISPYRFYYDYIKKNCKKIKGNICEFGVFQGRSLLSTALLLKKIKSKKKIFAFDTFAGFPNKILHKFDSFHNLKKDKYKKFLITKEIAKHTRQIKSISPFNISSNSNFSDVNYLGLKKKIEFLKLDNIVLIKGEFADTIPGFFKKNDKIFACNIDCDFYKSYSVVFENIYKNLSTNSYCHLDEYYSIKFPGPYQYLQEFISNYPGFKIIKNKTFKWEFDRYYLKKISEFI
jgi:hypothetical protein